MTAPQSAEQPQRRFIDRCCLDDVRDHTPLGCTRCGCLTPVWIAGPFRSMGTPTESTTTEGP